MRSFVVVAFGCSCLAGSVARAQEGQPQKDQGGASASSAEVQESPTSTPSVATQTTASAPGQSYEVEPLSLTIVPLGHSPDRKVEKNFSLALVGTGSDRIAGVELSPAFNLTSDFVKGAQFTGGININSGGLAGGEFAGGANIVRAGGKGVALAGGANIITGDFSGVQAGGGLNIQRGKSKWLLQMAGGFNIATTTLRGVQAAGGFNTLGGSAFGVQAAGGFNTVAGSAKGLQAAGGFNAATGDVSGVQAAGGFNTATGNFVGAQLAGGVNVVGDQTSGAQISLVNVSGDVRGSQVGLVNIATGSVTGTQVGVLNFARQYDTGAPVGLVSLVQHADYHPELWVSELAPLNVALRVDVTPHVYSMIVGNLSPSQHDQILGWDGRGQTTRLGAGFGLGLRLPVGGPFALRGDLIFNAVYVGTRARALSASNPDEQQQLRVAVEARFAQHVALFAGASMSSYMTFVGGRDSSSATNGVTSWTVSHHDFTARFWPGIFGGVSF